MGVNWLDPQAVPSSTAAGASHAICDIRLTLFEIMVMTYLPRFNERTPPTLARPRFDHRTDAILRDMLGKDYVGQDCSLARALEVLGERWTLLIVRDAFYGVRRFNDFQNH